MKMPPNLRTISVTILKYSLGGVMNPPTPWMGSAIRAATRPEHFTVAGGIFETERAAIAPGVDGVHDTGLRRTEFPGRLPGKPHGDRAAPVDRSASAR